MQILTSASVLFFLQYDYITVRVLTNRVTITQSYISDVHKSSQIQGLLGKMFAQLTHSTEVMKSCILQYIV
jgi:hypothetical protein